VVSAPIEIVRSLLTDTARWGDFFDVRITRVEPAGSAVVGQRFYGESGPRFLHIGRIRLESLSARVQERWEVSGTA